MRGLVRSIGCLCRCLWSCYVVLQTFFIFEGGQFSGLPVLGGSVVMILRNSSRNVVGGPGSIRYPSGVFLSVAVSPICSLISGGMQSRPLLSILR